jgi:hypothetical protein
MDVYASFLRLWGSRYLRMIRSLSASIISNESARDWKNPNQIVADAGLPFVMFNHGQGCSIA